ncbi:uncharacterized protein LOC123876533 [Maniola jurtina]|uniref:uncharacterized protein LOC123876533 n=1 Tax=Maniola jurtina TaxID=191418 RepID=UPI001E688DBA|nr:uncharacterized protein LOC123876533 [Maniola jurtina]
MQVSAAELVCGERLRLPGEFFAPAPRADVDQSTFVTQLRQYMARLRPPPVARHGQRSSFMFEDLKTCTHVWLRDDTVRPSLHPPYNGPYKVVRRTEKNCTILVGPREVVVRVDRLKPAYIDAETAPALVTKEPPVPANKVDQPQPKLITTRSGRTVKFKTPIDV